MHVQGHFVCLPLLIAAVSFLLCPRLSRFWVPLLVLVTPISSAGLSTTRWKYSDNAQWSRPKDVILEVWSLSVSTSLWLFSQKG